MRIPSAWAVAAGAVVVAVVAGGSVHRSACVGYDGMRRAEWNIKWPFSSDGDSRCESVTALRYLAGELMLNDKALTGERRVYDRDLIRRITSGSQFGRDVVASIGAGNRARLSWSFEQSATVQSVLRGRAAGLTIGDVEDARIATEASRTILRTASADLETLRGRLAGTSVDTGRYVTYSEQVQHVLSPWNIGVLGLIDAAGKAAFGFRVASRLYAGLDRCLAASERLIRSRHFDTYPTACLVQRTAARVPGPDQVAAVTTTQAQRSLDFFVDIAGGQPDARVLLAMVRATNPGGLLSPRRRPRNTPVV